MQERVNKPTKHRASTTKVTLEIDSKLAAVAAAKGVDLAALLEAALIVGDGDRRRQSLGKEELAGLADLERYVAEHGQWWDDAEVA